MEKIYAKRGATFRMPVKVDGISIDDVESITFVFKQQNAEDAPALKTSLFGDGGDVTREIKDGEGTNVLLIPWTDAETRLFSAYTDFFMDAKITVTGSTDNPLTEIVPIRMGPTLFEGADND